MIIIQKAIFSKQDFKNSDSVLTQEFLDSISSILDIEEIQELKNYYQHFYYPRFQHSVNVAYYSFLICRKLNLDYISASQAGILHDFYLYDWKADKSSTDGRHSYVHPRIALQNAKRFVKVNSIMEDAIVHHMWPMTLRCPKTLEGWVLQGVDKYCALSEFALQATRKIKVSRMAIYASLIVSFIN
ncbi:MAG: phosphohydrolase [Erysipelotrichaceae bacterium]